MPVIDLQSHTIHTTEIAVDAKKTSNSEQTHSRPSLNLGCVEQRVGLKHHRDYFCMLRFALDNSSKCVNRMKGTAKVEQASMLEIPAFQASPTYKEYVSIGSPYLVVAPLPRPHVRARWHGKYLLSLPWLPRCLKIWTISEVAVRQSPPAANAVITAYDSNIASSTIPYSKHQHYPQHEAPSGEVCREHGRNPDSHPV